MEPDLTAVRAALLTWYDDNARDLPWRRVKDPYAVWVSEIMLQQTRVDTVIPYFERFLARFPTPAALADATEDEVMSHWSGLGYYRRARLRRSWVKEVVARYGGEVPSSAEERRSLPGVGRYTAGAIGSIAFERPEPIVDGNVARVLARLLLIDSPLGQATTDKRLWAEAERLVQGERPGDLNQAVMELGATVCTPVGPRCGACPVRERCGAWRDDRVAELPVPKKKKPPIPVRAQAVVLRRKEDDAVWLVKQGDCALFRGLWGPPMAEGDDVAVAADVASDAGLQVDLQRPALGTVVHVLSHRRYQVDVFRAAGSAGDERDDRGWFPPLRLREVGVSRLTKKLLELEASRLL